LESWIARRASATPQDVALVHGNTRLTYAQFDARIRATAAHLAGLGIGVGDRIAFHGHNEPAALQTLFAAARLGAIWVPVHPARPSGDVRFILDDADARVVVRGRVDQPLQALPGRTMVEPQDLIDASLISREVPMASSTPDDLVMLAYTSGTVDAPKGVMLSHGNLTWNVVHMLTACAISRADVALAAAPFTRVGGLGVTVLPALFVGGTVVIPTGTDGDSVLREIERERVSVLFANPGLLDAMATAQSWPTADLGGIRTGVVGGGLVPDALLRTYLDRGVRLRHGYGLTEGAPVVTLLDERDAVTHAQSVGRPVGFVEVETRREDGRRCAADEVGEVVIRGPNVTRGYWRRTDATAAAVLPGGWFRTGYAGTIDADGYVTLEGRVSDAMRRPEGLVYPAELERLLYRTPGIADSAALLMDGRITLAIVPAAGATVSLQDVHGALAKHLPSWKLPNALAIVPSIPRNAAEKILRDSLHRALVEGRSN
jgi:fatty-acyl-CoA synthase